MLHQNRTEQNDCIAEPSAVVSGSCTKLAELLWCLKSFIRLFSSGTVSCASVLAMTVPGVSINVFNVLGGNWDPTDKKFSSVNSYRQDLLPTCKAFPKDTMHLVHTKS